MAPDWAMVVSTVGGQVVWTHRTKRLLNSGGEGSSAKAVLGFGMRVVSASHKATTVGPKCWEGGLWCGFGLRIMGRALAVGALWMWAVLFVAG